MSEKNKHTNENYLNKSNKKNGKNYKNKYNNYYKKNNYGTTDNKIITEEYKSENKPDIKEEIKSDIKEENKLDIKEDNEKENKEKIVDQSKQPNQTTQTNQTNNFNRSNNSQYSNQSNYNQYPSYYTYPPYYGYHSHPMYSQHPLHPPYPPYPSYSPYPPYPIFHPNSFNTNNHSGNNRIYNYQSNTNNTSMTSTQDKSVRKVNPELTKILKECILKNKDNENSIPKEYQWVEFKIETLDDLIELSKSYGTKYKKEYEYSIDLDLISNMTSELESLNKLVGLKGIKKQVTDLILYYALKLDNKNHDLLHTVIEGDPGTGKTEFAEKLSKIYLKMGILKKDVFKKVRRSDLIAGYLGQTAIKTEKVLEECRGGVLFIDEAYSLGNSEGKDGKDSFSKECLDMLNQWLTENKSEFVCIIAGYKDDLSKSFFSYNTGLERRFPIRFSIDTYTDDELSQIFIKKVKENEWNIECDNLKNIIKTNRKYFKYNGGDMEILFSKCKITHSKNLLKIKDKEKKVLTEKDIQDGIKLFLENPEFKKRGEVNNILSTIYV